MNLTGISREDFEGNKLICKNTVELEFSDDSGNTIPDTYAQMIGRKDLKSGELESCFKIDIENNRTQELEKILNVSKSVFEKQRNIVSKKYIGERSVVDYYIPYDIKESSKNKPTVTENYVTGCINGSWKCEYELLLTSGDGATMRTVIEQNTVNIGMVEWLADLEDEIEDALMDSAGTDFENIIKHDDCDECYITMFDEIGYPCDVYIESASEFINMIVSVRCIKCDFVRDTKTKK